MGVVKDRRGGATVQKEVDFVVNNGDRRIYIQSALRMDDALFVEYWGESVPPEKRIERWLEKADECATGWIPSKSLFQ